MALPWRVPSEPPVPCASARSQFLTCTAGCASPRSWRTASITLVMPPRLAGWLLHRPPPSVLNGSLPTPEIRLPSATNAPPSPFSQKPEVLELHQHRDGEAVVDRGVLDVGRLDAGLGEGRRAGPAPRRVVGRGRPGRPSGRLSASPAPMQLAPAAASGSWRSRARATISAPPPSLITQQSSRCSGSAIIGELTTSSTVTTSRSIACGLCCAWCEAATLIQASCSAGGAELVHVAHRAHRVACWRWPGRRGTRTGRRAALAPQLRGAVPVGSPRTRGRPASVISATLQRPAAIASAACATWIR